MKKYIILLFIILLSCTSNQDKDITFNTLMKREQYMVENESDRIFNPDSAVLISTLPNKLSIFTTDNIINDYEVIQSGAGYSKSYSHSSYDDCAISFYTYHSNQMNISEDINDSTVQISYENLQKELLKLNKNSKILTDNLLIFTTPSGNSIKMNEFVIEYKDIRDKNIRTYIYFGTNMNSYYRIKMTCDIDSKSYRNSSQYRENFVRDIAYYYAEGISLNEFIELKKTNPNIPVKMQRMKK